MAYTNKRSELIKELEVYQLWTYDELTNMTTVKLEKLQENVNQLIDITTKQTLAILKACDTLQIS